MSVVGLPNNEPKRKLWLLFELRRLNSLDQFLFYTYVQVVRCLLIEPFPESALNEEAGKMLMEDYEGYAKHARSVLVRI